MSELSVDDDLSAALAGDDAAFGRLVAPLQRELRAHCYRMLGSIHDADDALQDALVRAWRGFARFERRSALRTWLYTVTTRVCLDALAHRSRRVLPMDLGPASEHPVFPDAPAGEVRWLTPYPSDVAAGYERRESVELAFVAACQHLPGNQRAALLLFDVLGFSAAEIADVMDTSVASVTSALQRARRLVSERVPGAADRPAAHRLDDAPLRRTVAAFADALERGDADALVALLTADVTWSMPPLPHWYAGSDSVRAFALEGPLRRCGHWRHRFVRANDTPAVASYLDPGGGTDPGSGTHTAWSINVFAFSGARVAAVTSFIGDAHFRAFGLPLSV